MHLLFSIILSLFLATIAYYKKAMTMNALILAFIFSCIITYYGGLASFLILCTVFLGTVIAGLIQPEKRRAKSKDIHAKGHAKDVQSIIANVMPGTLVLLLNIPYMQVIYAALMAEAIADSLASDIGILSDKPPYNILTLKKSTHGLSGNISPLGMSAALIGSAIIGLIYFLFNHNFTYFLIITICGFLGNLLDSFLGALLQVKYECPKCHIITEQENHCNTKTIRKSGNKFFNNDVVNLLTNALTGLLCYLLLIIF